MKNLFKVGDDAPPAVQVVDPAAPAPAAAPLPPRRAAANNSPVRMAALPQSAPKADADQTQAH